jgi:CelD/BcsL family acetyltransferase involved in cellulose biosynthesis
VASSVPLSTPAHAPVESGVAAGARTPAVVRLVDHSHPLWAGLFGGSRHATPFHHPSWSAVVAGSYGYRRFAAVLADGERALAGLPLIEVRGPTRRRRWLSLPFTDSCAPLADDPAHLDELVRQLDEERARAGVSEIEIRAPVAVPGVWPCVAGVTHTLELAADADAVRRTFSRSQVHRNIVRAEREGVRVEWGTTKEDLTERFYGLHLATRRRQGVPVQPRRFFEQLWSQMIEPGLGFVLVAYADTAPAAAAVFLHWNDTVIYKFGASDASFWGLRPNHLLFWSAIRWSCEQGYARFDFGKTDLDNDGLRAFKSGWGAIEEPLAYSVIAQEQPAPHGRSRLAEAMGAAIRRSPPFVCRTLGATLYRYAA